jgi:hypothetical protein
MVQVCDASEASFAGLKGLIAKEVPEGAARRFAMERIEQRLDPTKALKGEDVNARRPLEGHMRRASPGNGARWAALRKERRTCFTH